MIVARRCRTLALGQALDHRRIGSRPLPSSASTKSSCWRRSALRCCAACGSFRALMLLGVLHLGRRFGTPISSGCWRRCSWRGRWPNNSARARSSPTAAWRSAWSASERWTWPNLPGGGGHCSRPSSPSSAARTGRRKATFAPPAAITPKSAPERARRRDQGPISTLRLRRLSRFRRRGARSSTAAPLYGEAFMLRLSARGDAARPVGFSAAMPREYHIETTLLPPGCRRLRCLAACPTRSAFTATLSRSSTCAGPRPETAKEPSPTNEARADHAAEFAPARRVISGDARCRRPRRAARLVSLIGLMLALGYLVVLGGAFLDGHFLTDKQGRPIANDFVNVFAAGSSRSPAILPPPMTGRGIRRPKSAPSATPSPTITAGIIRRLSCLLPRRWRSCPTLPPRSSGSR